MIPAVMPTYARYDVALERGEGVYAFGTDGRRYLDFGAGIAVASLGHCHPHLVDALKSQAETLWHVSNLYNIPGQERLAERLVANTFADAVFFNNSGNEAVELGFKMIRKFQSENGHPERYRIISVEGAFHGRSLAGLAAGKQATHTAGFGPMTDGFDQVAFGNLNEMKAAVTPETAGIVVEPIQGEGGIRPTEDGQLKALREICDENGLLLILDEVQCGVGRTGKLFAYEWAGITPDIMMVAKGIGGGFPLGAVLATENAALGMTPGTHGSTYGGNPLGCAVGCTVLDTVADEAFLSEVSRKAGRLRQRLEGLVAAHPDVFASVRGEGLMLGLVCTALNADVLQAGYDAEVITVPAAENVLRILPPLTISDAEIDEAVSRLDAAAKTIEAA